MSTVLEDKDTLVLTKVIIFVRIENNVGKGENAGYLPGFLALH